MNDFTLGIQIMVIGMGVVFASLIGLTYLMEFMHRLFGEKEKEKDVTKSPAPAVSPEATSPEKDPASAEVPAEVIAAITAGLAAYLDTAAPIVGARIKVVRRQIPLPASTWGMAGRQDQMHMRQMG
ncbi:MAG: OadG family protein [Firmicutes bacterium]|nr:OadG family protein [Bacillota bacterium]